MLAGEHFGVRRTAGSRAGLEERANDGGRRCTSPSARDLFAEAFNPWRSPRSPEYRAGALEHLRYRLMEREDCRCPYREGTAAADAWYAGVSESWQILEKHGADRRATGVPR